MARVPIEYRQETCRSAPVIGICVGCTSILLLVVSFIALPIIMGTFTYGAVAILISAPAAIGLYEIEAARRREIGVGKVDSTAGRRRYIGWIIIINTLVGFLVCIGLPARLRQISDARSAYQGTSLQLTVSQLVSSANRTLGRSARYPDTIQGFMLAAGSSSGPGSVAQQLTYTGGGVPVNAEPKRMIVCSREPINSDGYLVGWSDGSTALVGRDELDNLLRDASGKGTGSR